MELDTPLISFTGSQSGASHWTIRNAVEGVQVFGGIGSGKTSGSGRMLALKYLQHGFGGLVLTVKPDEKDLWQSYCALTGRTKDLLIVEPGAGHFFNFLEYESTGGDTQNIVQVLKTVINAGTGKMGEDPFWETALDMLISHVIDLCRLAYPLIATELAAFFKPTHGGEMFMMRNQPTRNDSTDLMPDYLGWYIYLAAFVFLAFRHNRDIKRAPSVFDFARFSKYTGKVNQAFFRFNLPDRKTDLRRVECLFEPALFFVGGVLLHLVGQKLGDLLILCSLFYGFSYAAAYVIGDNFVMDKIDEMICNQELEKSFVDDKDESETRGFRFRGAKPNSNENRRKVLTLLNEQDEVLRAE